MLKFLEFLLNVAMITEVVIRMIALKKVTLQSIAITTGSNLIAPLLYIVLLEIVA